MNLSAVIACAKLLKGTSDPRVLEQACGILRNLSTNIVAAGQIRNFKGAVEALTALRKNDDAKVAEQAACTLMNVHAAVQQLFTPTPAPAPAQGATPEAASSAKAAGGVTPGVDMETAAAVRPLFPPTPAPAPAQGATPEAASSAKAAGGATPGVDTYDNFDQVALAVRLEKHDVKESSDDMETAPAPAFQFGVADPLDDLVASSELSSAAPSHNDEPGPPAAASLSREEFAIALGYSEGYITLLWAAGMPKISIAAAKAWLDQKGNLFFVIM